VRNVLIRIMAAALAMAALTGCDGRNESPGTPGTATAYLHGNVGTSIGVSSH
jgi:hypothetical protein